MKILHVSARASTGGGPEMIRTLIQGSLSSAEHWVACPAGGLYAEEFRRLLGPSRVLSFPVNPARIKPDILHTHGFGAGLTRVALLHHGIPAVHTFHGFYPGGTGVFGGAVRLAAESALMSLTRAAVAVSDSERALVKRLCPPLGRKTVVIPNGVKPRTLDPVPQSGLPPVRILVVGRLVYQKFPELAVRIAAECRRLDPTLEFQFRLAGAGPLEPAVKEETRRLGVQSCVVLLGDVADIGSELASAQIYLSTARWEGLSLALLEAMHAALPCVATRVQGNVDAIGHGHTGFLFDPLDPVEAARHIVLLARDPLTRKALGAHARAAAQIRFSAEAMCGQYLDLYRSVLSPVAHSATPSCARSRS